MVRARDADGRIRRLHATTAAAQAPQDAVSGILRDVTEMHGPERAPDVPSDVERMAGEAARIGGWRHEVATRRLHTTRGAARLVGVPGGRALSVEDVIARFASAQDRPRVVRSFWTCAGAGGRFDEVASFLGWHGKDIWLRILGRAERDPSGRIVALHGALQDVGDLVTARLVAQGDRALVQGIPGALPDGVVVHARGGTIRHMNRVAHDILRVSDRDLVGRNPWRDLPRPLGPQ